MRARRDRGFALLIVLWTLALLALFGTRLVAAGRNDAQLARNLTDAAILEAAADGAVQQAIFQLLLPPGRGWQADGSVHPVRLGAAAVTLRLEDEGGKVNPNLASTALLRALLLQVGAPPATAAAVAAAIADWRTAGSAPGPLGAKAPQYAAAGREYGPPGSDFRSVDELGFVLGMTPALLARLRPHLTVYSDADPDGTTRDPVVAAALAAAGESPAGGAAGLQVVTVTVLARGPGRAAYGERAVVRLNGAAGSRAYDLLALERDIPEPSVAPGAQNLL